MKTLPSKKDGVSEAKWEIADGCLCVRHPDGTLNIPQPAKHLIYGYHGVFHSRVLRGREVLVLACKFDKPYAFATAVLVDVQVPDSCEEQGLCNFISVAFMGLKPGHLHQVFGIMMVVCESTGILKTALQQFFHCG